MSTQALNENKIDMQMYTSYLKHLAGLVNGFWEGTNNREIVASMESNTRNNISEINSMLKDQIILLLKLVKDDPELSKRKPLVEKSQEIAMNVGFGINCHSYFPFFDKNANFNWDTFVKVIENPENAYVVSKLKEMGL